jgi:hypothetical protein
MTVVVDSSAPGVVGDAPVGVAGDEVGAGPLGEELPTGELPVGAGTEVLCPVGCVSVTGQTVVDTAMVEVTTVVESAGQLVTVGAQLVMVTSLVV